MKRKQRKIPPFKVWCRTCNGTNSVRDYEDNQGDLIVLGYTCPDCGEKWKSVYKKQVTKSLMDDQ